MTDDTKPTTDDKQPTTEEKKEEKANEKETSGPSVEEKESAKTTEDSLSDKSEDASSVEVPKEFQKLVEQVESMSVLELNELVKVLEKRFGVSATAVAAGPAAGDESAEEQSSFTVELTAMGDKKIAVIKVVKLVSGLGLKEAKDLVESAPAVVKEEVKKEEAEELKAKLEEAGATVTLK